MRAGNVELGDRQVSRGPASVLDCFLEAAQLACWHTPALWCTVKPLSGSLSPCIRGSRTLSPTKMVPHPLRAVGPNRVNDHAMAFAESENGSSFTATL